MRSIIRKSMEGRPDDEEGPSLLVPTEIAYDGQDVDDTLKKILSKMDDQFREIKETLYVSADSCCSCIHDLFHHSTHIHLFVLPCVCFSFARSEKVVTWKTL